jgi:hypothetical protein
MAMGWATQQSPSPRSTISFVMNRPATRNCFRLPRVLPLAPGPLRLLRRQEPAGKGVGEMERRE